MPKTRRIEAFRLIISGLTPDTSYLVALRDAYRELGETMRLRRYGKTHILHEVTVFRNELRLLFISYKAGYRPDVIAEEGIDYVVEETPLLENQANVEFTHCVGRKIGDRFVLLIEKNLAGCSYGSVEEYLQAMFDRTYNDALEEAAGDQEPDADPIVINIEPIPSEAFRERLDALAQIKEVVYRIPRPNPGWADLETDLGEQSDLSDAATAEIRMTARRKRGLSEDHGIVNEIRTKLAEGLLNFAKIAGLKPNGEEDRFSSDKLNVYKNIRFELDDRGQIIHNDAWRMMRAMLDEIG